MACGLWDHCVLSPKGMSERRIDVKAVSWILIVVVCLALSPEAGAQNLSGMSEEDLLVFTDKLEKGEPHTCEFKHPVTGETLEHKIVGIVDGRCLYIQGMPGGGRMECRLTEKSRKAFAKHFRASLHAKSTSYEKNVTSSIDGKEIKGSRTMMNGKVVENPLEDCLNNGDCVIKGYDGAP